MKVPYNKARVQLYLWIGVAYFVIWLIVSINLNQGLVLKKASNLTLLCFYLVVVNYVFFEYALPLIKLNWKGILLAPVLLFAYSITLAFGTYFWRALLVELHLYFSYKEHASAMDGAEYYTPFSHLSVLFFGVIKFTYDQRKLKAMTQQLRKEKQEAEQNYLEAQSKSDSNIKKEEATEDHIFINFQKKRVKIVLDDILYIESQKEYIKIVTRQKEYLTKMSTHQMESILPDRQFHRVHRSFIVPIQKVQSYTSEKIEVAGISIPIGRKYKASTLELLQ